MAKTPQNPLPERHLGDFVFKHIGPDHSEQAEMLKALNTDSLSQLISETVPKAIRSEGPMDLRAALTEAQAIDRLKELASENIVAKSMIGQGYYDTITPTVVLRNVLENPAWYTAYTPYQAEISQGRLEALLNFQTMVMELTGMAISNASLLDEGTAAAEAMTMAFNLQRKNPKTKILVDKNCFQQSIDVIATRAEPLGLEVEVLEIDNKTTFDDCFAVISQYPGKDGQVEDLTPVISKIREAGALSIVATDLAALCLLKPPGEMGADIVVGSTQRFGVPMGYGGPHAAFLATSEKFKRNVPGRIVGVSIDTHEKPALRLALQTREQHIRREKATSNICTAQVLLAVMSSMYAVFHGPKKLKEISTRISTLTSLLASQLTDKGFKVSTTQFFDTIKIDDVENLSEIKKRAQKMNFNFFYEGNSVYLSCDETTSLDDISSTLQIFSGDKSVSLEESHFSSASLSIPKSLLRTDEFMSQDVFNSHHSETEILRYMYRLQQKDLSLTHSMIPLGSCTMKLNATTEMIPVTWEEFGRIHPFAPVEQTQGYLKLIHELEHMLAEMSGFAAVSLQPNAGSQGEYAGLLAIRKFHQANGDDHRNICLIPSSAHGTNPASAVMAGMKVVVVACDDQGNIDVEDLKIKVDQHKENLSSLMITYPSTHGVFEEAVKDICKMVKDAGGQVYMDGANTNAMIGLCKPGEFGPDVMHFNLHKTFCIPHGGGGPGVGPIGVSQHLKKYLPNHSMLKEAGPESGLGATTAAPFGSASILPISWTYVTLMGPEGLKHASEVAILNANYMAKKLEGHYDVLYKGANGRVAHECILDVRPFKALGVTVDDIAKRLIDYGYHAPTMSWPVVGTLMVEPTESESKAELDRFCDAMISIKEEIDKIEQGKWSKEDNPLVNAPHTVNDLVTDWKRSYTREEACFPRPWVKEHKFWASVNRVNNAHGDKNLVCSCLPLEAYEEN